MRLLPIVAVLFAPSIALAHISITSPTPRYSDQKEQHCGRTANTRANVHFALPGSTLTLVWAETIQHPGYFRVSFQEDGSIFRIPAAGAGAGGFPDENLTGMTDLGSGSLILADRIADGTLTVDVTLPAIECANCTLQLIQLMTDKPPYTIDAMSDDIYFQCVDLVLSNSPPPVDAAGNPGDPDGGTDGGSSVSGGCSTGRGSSGLGALALIGLGLAFRRRRA
jgi:MYXO-CTERM domain-containing protein